MSWKIINEILGLAVTDDDFAHDLLTNSVDAVEKRGYRLTTEEREAFHLSSSDTLLLFSQRLLRNLSTAPSNERE